jgi:hypothetical protein
MREDAKAQSEQKGYDILFSMAAGEDTGDGVRYSPKRIEELQWGPKALAIAPDGSFLIANTVAKNLLHISADGRLLNTIDLAGIAAGVMDLKATEAGIFALDGAARIPTVLHLTYGGKLIAKHEIPTELRDYFTGLVVSEEGELLIEHQAQIVYRLLDENGAPNAAPIEGLSTGGAVVRTQSSTRDNLSHGSITIGSVKVCTAPFGLDTNGA